jgi:tryptophanyl-tRNA synthetase
MVYCYHTKLNEPEAPGIEADCRSGALGCVDCKANLSRKLADYFATFRERREALAAKPDVVRGHVEDGTRRARAEAGKTMAMVHDAMGI